MPFLPHAGRTHHAPHWPISRPVSLSAILLTAIVLVWTLSPANAHAQSPELGFDEREAQNIDRMIMCPVCPAETIDQAQVEISLQMRALVREMLAEGRTREDILDFFVDRYGPDILAAPPKSGVNLVAWILPIVGVLVGLTGVYFVIRAMTNREKGAGVVLSPGPSADELAPYLDLVDQQLALNRGSGVGVHQISPTDSPDLASRTGGPLVEHPGENAIDGASDGTG